MAVPYALLAGMAMAGMQAHSQNKREKRSYQNQLDIMREQRDNQKYLDDHGASLQYDLWKKTNYSAQMDEMRKAGLNPSMMYGMAGAGGATTGSQGGGSAQGGQAPQPQQLDIAGAMQVGLMKAQKENIEADTANKKADALKKGGPDTELSQAQANNLNQNTETERFNTLLKQIEAMMEAERVPYAKSRAESEAIQKDEDWRRTEWDNRYSQESFNTKLELLKAQTTNTEIKNNIDKAIQQVKEFEARLAKDGIHYNSPWYAKLLTDLIQKAGILDLIKGM